MSTASFKSRQGDATAKAQETKPTEEGRLDTVTFFAARYKRYPLGSGSVTSRGDVLGRRSQLENVNASNNIDACVCVQSRATSDCPFQGRVSENRFINPPRCSLRDGFDCFDSNVLLLLLLYASRMLVDGLEISPVDGERLQNASVQAGLNASRTLAFRGAG